MFACVHVRVSACRIHACMCTCMLAGMPLYMQVRIYVERYVSNVHASCMHMFVTYVHVACMKLINPYQQADQKEKQPGRLERE